MQTSNFATWRGHWDDPRLVAISLGVPRGWHGRWLRRLAPSGLLLNDWHEHRITWGQYVMRYRVETLARLNAAEVAAELGPDAILLCWEPDAPHLECHRRLVAHWFQGELGILVPEWEPENSSTSFA